MDFWKILSDTALKTPINVITRIFQSKIGIFIYGIMSQWYIIIALGSTIVVFWVFKGLKEAGVLDDAMNIVQEAIEDSKAIAQHCTPKIRNLEAMWICIQNPPKYRPSKSEQQLIDNIEHEKQKLQDSIDHANDEDPYN